MKLYNGGKIIAGLVVFLVLVISPFLYNMTVGESLERPKIEPQATAEHPNCVEDVDYMRVSHMDLLNEWRDLVVRDGERIHEAPDGTKYNMSLSQTCLDCHSNKEEFCDKCHDFMSVDPYCWDCHNVPGGE